MSKKKELYETYPYGIQNLSLFEMLEKKLSNGPVRLDEFVKDIGEQFRQSIYISVPIGYHKVLLDPFESVSKDFAVTHVLRDIADESAIVLKCEPVKKLEPMKHMSRNLGSWIYGTF